VFDRPKPTAGCSANGRKKEGIPLHMTALYVKLCHINDKNLMCCFSGERQEEAIGTKGIKNERKSVEEEEDMKTVILLLRFTRCSSLLYLIAVNTY
jgi:hypothetical protein